MISGRVAQGFNQRKRRKGAFWEDRYHATAVDSGEHLIRRLVDIDLNMVRAGVVNHPSEWEMSGYKEILNPRERYSVIDREGETFRGRVSKFHISDSETRLPE